MSNHKFQKILSPNDTGESGSHQAGIAIPKRPRELVEFLPKLDPSEKNPDVWIDFLDEENNVWKMRYIYYNNRLHDPKGTRNEYRLTHVSEFLKSHHGRAGDVLIIYKDNSSSFYRIALEKNNFNELSKESRIVVRLQGWRQVH
jgi:hypothetical protein